MKSTVHIEPVAVNDFQIPWEGGPARVIGLVEGQIVTEALEEEPLVVDSATRVRRAARDLLKIAVVERHLSTGRIGLGFVRGFGLQKGAMASTIAHDAHNIVVVGADDGDMARASSGSPSSAAASSSSRAAACRRSCRCRSPAALRRAAGGGGGGERGLRRGGARLGCTYPSPFQTMAFLAPVIPR